jgi:hypothetical protein
MHQRKIFRLEPLDVAEHLVLGVIAIKGGVREERRGACVRSGELGELRVEG